MQMTDKDFSDSIDNSKDCLNINNTSTNNDKVCNLSCHVKCPFFPNLTNGEIPWVYNKDGLKIRKTKQQYICGYDGHVIKNWVDKCPYNKDLEKKVEVKH